MEYNYHTISLSAENMLQKIRELFFPPGPVVSNVMSPIVRPVGNAFCRQDGVQFSSPVEQIVFPRALTNAEDNRALFVKVHPGVIVWHIGQEMNRRVRINQIVHVLMEKVLTVEQPAHAQERIKQVGTTEKEVPGVKSTHAAPASHRLLIAASESGKQFIDNVMKPAFLQLNSFSRVAVLI